MPLAAEPLSITAIVMVIVKTVGDIYVARRDKKRAVVVANSNGKNPGKSGSSTDLVLFMLKDHGEKLEKLDSGVTKLNDEMTEAKVEIGKVKTKLDMK